MPSDVEGCSLVFWSTGQLRFSGITQMVTEPRWEHVKAGDKACCVGGTWLQNRFPVRNEENLEPGHFQEMADQ